ncbi:13557_t:CDS:2 [Entrophospora sp. SA101]|nr:2897_t:CDS:2 [Entrophospora sp. SA101]CAJ0641985.1 13557_t:CDS:2 [Entrophospora sp. SA101]CAJ0896061.1 12529_t:CDS:2 [Entrophospora sp. SA101]
MANLRPQPLVRQRSSANKRLSQIFNDEDDIINLTPNESARKRQFDKDEKIRKKAEHDLTKVLKMQGKRPFEKLSRSAGLIGILRPSAPITLPETTILMDAAKLMVVNRVTAVLVVDECDKIMGIVTDKDITFRVCAEGLNPNATTLSMVMTRNPDCVDDASDATEALNRMASGGYRHLPVIDSADRIIGLLDITECLFHALERLEKANQSTKNLFAVLEEHETLNNKNFASMAAIIKKHLCFPKVLSVAEESKDPPEISIKTNVGEAAKIMKEFHQTAALVVDECGKTVGILTSKDIVTRIYANNVDPARTSTVRVMTPAPDMISTDTTILQALKQMQEKHYQHLPVYDEENIVISIVDVLKLTYAILNILKGMNGEQGDKTENGPVWNKFWNTADDPISDGSISNPTENENSFHSSEIVDLPIKTNASSTVITTPYSVSHSKSTSTSVSNPGIVTAATTESNFTTSSKNKKSSDGKFVYKCKDEMSKQSHRFTSTTQDFNELCNQVRAKMNFPNDVEIIISYIDDENDKITLSSNEDLITAMKLARSQRHAMIRLYIEAKPNNSSASSFPFNNIIIPDHDDFPNKNRSSSNSPTNTLVSPTEELEASVKVGGFVAIGVAIGVGIMWIARAK